MSLNFCENQTDKKVLEANKVSQVKLGFKDKKFSKKVGKEKKKKWQKDKKKKSEKKYKDKT